MPPPGPRQGGIVSALHRRRNLGSLRAGRSGHWLQCKACGIFCGRRYAAAYSIITIEYS